RHGRCSLSGRRSAGPWIASCRDAPRVPFALRYAPGRTTLPTKPRGWAAENADARPPTPKGGRLRRDVASLADDQPAHAARRLGGGAGGPGHRLGGGDGAGGAEAGVLVVRLLVPLLLQVVQLLGQLGGAPAEEGVQLAHGDDAVAVGVGGALQALDQGPGEQA